jgi:hypothetical protein
MEKSGHLDFHFSAAVDLRLLKKVGRGVHWRITRGLAPIFGDVDPACNFSVAHRHVHEPAPFRLRRLQSHLATFECGGRDRVYVMNNRWEGWAKPFIHSRSWVNFGTVEALEEFVFR